MDLFNEFLIVSLLAFAITVVGVSLQRRTIRRNYWLGFRFKSALASDHNWYAVNAFGGRLLTVWGILLMIISLAAGGAYLSHLLNIDYQLVIAGLLLITSTTMLNVIFSTYAYARSL